MKWLPIETAPKDGRYIFLWKKEWNYPVASKWSHRSNKWTLASVPMMYRGNGATHWAEIQDLPR